MEEDLDDSTLTVNNGGAYDPNTRTLKWFIGELGSKQKGSVSFSVNAKTDLADGTEIINFATVYFPSVPEATRTNGTVNRITTSTDTTPPVTTATISPLPNPAGWNNTDVTITLTAADNEGGSGLSKTEYSLDNINWTIYTTPFTITNEGTTTVYYKSTDNLNNIESSKSLEIKLDKTPPTITSQASPQPNSSGWNNTDVTVVFNATDILSGVSSVTQPQTITTEGANQYIGGEAVDLAGNIATASAIINLDKTPPTITASTSPQPNANGWNNSAVTVSFTAEDALSGVQSITQPITVTTEGANQVRTGEAIDFADNKATTSVTLNIDKTPPQISITANPNTLWPPDHKLLDVTINGNAWDTLSGIASTVFSVEDEYNIIEPNISAFGSIIQLESWREGNDKDGKLYTISVTAQDKANNQATTSAQVLCPHDEGKK